MKYLNLFRSLISSVLLALMISAAMFSPAFADENAPPLPTDTTSVVDIPSPDDPVSNPEESALIPQDSTTSDIQPSPEVPTLPEQTDLVVLDENGANIPLASQEAAD